MIGWYVDAGIYHGNYDNPPKNLSDIEFLDINVPYILPVIPPGFVKGTIYGSNDLIEGRNILQQMMGSDFNFFQIINDSHRTATQEVWDSIKTVFPASDSSFFNVNKYCIGKTQSEQRNLTVVIHFKSLKRIVCMFGLSLGVGNVLDVLDDSGSIGPIESNRYARITQVTGSSKGLIIYTTSLAGPYTSSEMLNINSNYVDYKIGIGSDYFYNDLKKNYAIQFQKSAPYGFPSTLYGGTIEPDFDGPDIPPDNPYRPGGPSKPGDLPPGTFDDKSDPIPDSTVPSISAANTGFTRIYNPTLAQVQELANYLWTDETVVQTIWNKVKQYFEDPMQAIIGFNLVPVTVPNGGTEEFKLMYIPTGVQMTVAANQFVDVDCGSVKLERYYGSALDQSPYTKVSCFLPYIGTVQLNTDEVMGATLQVKYRVDIVSGSCVAKIFVDGNVLYQYSGHCAINIPTSSADFSTYVSSAISVAKLAVGAAVGGAMGALAAGGTDPSQQTNQVVTTTRTETETTRNPTTGRQITAGTRTTVETRESPANTSSTQASFDYLSPYNIANTVGQVMSSKPHVQHSGSFSGNTGYLGIRRPFLIIERPNMCLPEQYQTFNGYPAMITMNLADCKGYTKIQQIQLTELSATNPEQAEIMGLLKSGVFF